MYFSQILAKLQMVIHNFNVQLKEVQESVEEQGQKQYCKIS